MFEATDKISTFSYDSSDEGASPDLSLSPNLQKQSGQFFALMTVFWSSLRKEGITRCTKFQPVTMKFQVLSFPLLRMHPRDKVEPEIATLQYIDSMHTPLVYAWNTEDDNPVIPGVPTNGGLGNFTIHKQVVVFEVAGNIIQLFRLRFDTGGSLYRVRVVDQENFHVGPVDVS
ncbi:hypothetical protein EV359DRAFT_79666 [Lentinula novae-zelandiae]|nr:hypothetical protein EV359DRAFT_79666 [Lentinula novae-zelandiae]